MRQFLYSIIILSLLVFSQSGVAQQQVTFTLSETGPTVPAAPSSTEMMDSLQARAFAEDWLQTAWSNGHLMATYRVQAVDSQQLQVQLNPGQLFRWIALTRGNLPVAMQGTVNFKPKYFTDETLQPKVFAQMAQQVVRYYEEQGYPFAAVGLDSVTLDTAGGVRAALRVDPGPFITIDTFQISGEVNISAAYLARYLDVIPGEPYKESRIQQMSERLNNLTFLRSTQSPEVLFIQDKALIRLYLEERNASTFNFLIGILPNSDQQGGRLLVNGEAMLRLENPFGGGRSLLVDWKNLQPRSPQLRAEVSLPYLLQSPVGVDGTFHLFKRDTFWVDIEATVGLRYALQGNDYFRVFLRNKSSNLITVDTATIIQNRTLPDRLDLRYNWLGIAFARERLDYRFNPRSGYRLIIEASGGSRGIRPNSAIVGIEANDFDYGSLYDSISEPVLSTRLSVQLEKYWPIGQQATFLTAYQGGFLYAPTIWRNELFRIGGNQLLRGFDEESILSNHFHTLTAEFRYLLGRNAYFNLFGDIAYVERAITNETRTVNWPVGLGGGLAFETGAGIFEVNYALGRLNEDNPFQFRKGRVHLGYVSYF